MEITCYCDLYTGLGLKKKKARILKRIKQNKIQPFLYLITLAKGEQNHLEFFSASLLKQQVFNPSPLFLVGIAESYEEAMYLVEEITQNVVTQTGGTDIRSYILNRQKNFEEGRA